MRILTISDGKVATMSLEFAPLASQSLIATATGAAAAAAAPAGWTSSVVIRLSLVCLLELGIMMTRKRQVVVDLGRGTEFCS
jgi:hypothetical protein